MIAVGNEFHIVTDWHRKDRCPAADLYPGISNLFLFLVFRSCTVALVTKRGQRYLGASPLTHLNVRMPTVYFNVLLTGSQFKSLRTGVMCSNFLEPVTTLAAKFWTLCSLETFFFVVLDHTGEQENNRLNTKVWITFSKDFESKRCLILLIWHRLAEQDETVFVICSSKLSVASISMPRSLAELDGVTSLPSKVKFRLREIRSLH